MTRPRLRVINPNSSQSVTEQIALAMRAVGLAADFDFVTCTAGPPGVVTQADFEQAATLVAADIAQHQQASDAIVIGCFSDPGVRTPATTPIVGLGESGMRAAIAAGGAVGVLAVAEAAIPRHLRYWSALGLGEHVVGERGLELRVDQSGDLDLALPRAIAAARALRDGAGARAILLGCAGMAPLREPLAAELGIPVIEPCEAAVREAFVRAKHRLPKESL